MFHRILANQVILNSLGLENPVKKHTLKYLQQSNYLFRERVIFNVSFSIKSVEQLAA